MSSAATIRAGSAVPCRPCPRFVLTPAAWARLVPDDLVFEAAWADTTAVYALFTDPAGQPLLASVPTNDGGYAALSPRFPAAAAPERMIRDLWGHEAEAAADPRPWLDHGRFGFTRPLARHGPPAPADPVLRPVPDGLMQIPVGPVSGRLEEPVHLRVATDGLLAHSVEARLGYAHKGTLLLVRGKSPRAAARFAARLSADATVAHALAFAQAAEAALGVAAPPRAAVLRGAMAELERIATHLADLATCCRRVPRLAWHREHLLGACGTAFGHRMMMDCVVPGGLAADISAPALPALLACLDGLHGDLATLAARTARVGAGAGIPPEAALHAHVPAGIVGRAAGSAADARTQPGYPPYHVHRGAALRAGDVAARLQLRLLEIGDSIALLRDWLASLPEGPISLGLPSGSGEGLAAVEGPHGTVWHWLRLDGGTIGSAFFADPAWRLWPVLEAACAGAPLADLPLIVASFGCTRSGIDL